MSADPLLAKAIFLQAVENHAPDQWPAFLDQACAGRPELRGRVNVLLEAHREAGTEPECPASTPVTHAEVPLGEGPGMVIGPYKVLEQIGEGGFGVVFMAEQQVPIRRKVALKVLKPGMDTRRVIARFQAERQALALMDHPNIARMLDAGSTPSGRPYFVMELVKGLAITDYCDREGLPLRERLELFGHICQAVQHAHQKGVIHRDLKPSNVLVTLQEGAALVKVIDFGIAKALGQPLTDKTLYTGFAELIGTPVYMAPEQMALSNVDVDTRSDIYALGVLLYELLTGTTPFDSDRLRQAGYDEMRRIIREEEPPKPSTRLSTLGQAATTISTQRQSDPRRLSQLFRGELDWIVMKALAKERHRRYDTASALAADVQRYLHDEPVQACPPSTLYRLRKLVRRNRGTMTAAALVLTALLVGTLGLLVSNVRIAEEQALTRKQRDEAEANFGKARQAVHDQLTLVSQSTLFNTPGFQVLRKQLLESALGYYEGFLRQRPDDPVLQAEVAAAHLRLYQLDGAIYGTINPEEMEHLDQGVTIVEKLLRDQGSEGALYQPLAGFAKPETSLYNTGYSAPKAQVTESLALALYHRAAAAWEALVRDNPAEPGFASDLASYYGALQELLAAVGRAADALDYARKALALREQIALAQPGNPDGRVLLAGAHNDLASRLRPTGLSEERGQHLRREVELRQNLLKDYPQVANYRADLAGSQLALGEWLKEQGRLREAEQAYQQASAVLARLVAEFPAMPGYRNALASSHEGLGHLFRDMGQSEKAERSYRDALTHYDKLAADFPDSQWYRLAYSRFCLARLLAARGQEAEAQRIFEAMLDYKPQSTDGRNIMAVRLAACPDPRFRDLRRALQEAKQAVAEAPANGYIWNTLGLAHYRNGNWPEALTALEKSMQLGSGGDSFDRFLLAMTHWQMGHKEQARDWFRQGVEYMETREQHSMSEEMMEDLKDLRREAAELLGIPDQPKGKGPSRGTAPGR
jgi:serine/threonine protein kinase/tetratricopeptide (TPR) repeat protein